MRWTTCQNPFKDHSGKAFLLTRTISAEFKLKCDAVLGHRQLLEGQNLCSKCYGAIRNQYEKIILAGMEEEPMEEDAMEEDQMGETPLCEQLSHSSIASEDAQFTFDACLKALNIPKISTGLTNSQKIAEIKDRFFSISNEVQKLMDVLLSEPVPLCAYKKCPDCENLTNDIKAKFPNLKAKKEKLQLATCLPKSLSIEEIMTMLNVARGEGKKISKLRNKKGAFSFIEPKKRKRVSGDTIEKVKEYYLSPLYSKILPGQYDTVYSDKSYDGKKERVAKQLMLITLSELFTEFTQQNPEHPISLSEFAKNRPRQCRWVWNKGQHRNCTCIIHENFKLLLESTCSSKIGSKTEKIIGEILCEEATNECWLGLCSSCPRDEKIDALFTEIDEDDEISFYQWVSTDRTDLSLLTESATLFCDRIRSYIPKITLHCFINRQQHTFFESLKKKLETEKAIMANVDFGQNYTFVIQDSVQSYHWSPAQATLHPFAMEYFDMDLEELTGVIYVVISDCLEHSAATFYAFNCG